MNILMLNYEFPPIGGGASPVSYDIAKLLVQNGHSVSVVTMAFSDLPCSETKDGIQIYRVNCLRKKANVCHPWEQLSYISSAKKFLKIHMRTHKYDINYTHFIIPTGAVSLWVKKKFGLNYIITAHGSDVIGHNNQRFKILYKLLKNSWIRIVKNASCVVSPSQHLMDLMKKTYSSGNFTVIPNGIFVNDYKNEDKKDRILVMSRLQKSKGIQTILQAIKVLDMKNWKLDIVGDGPYKSELIQMCEQLGISDKVIFHGWVENKSAKHIGLLARDRVFISASKFESFSIVAAEAIVSGAYPLLSDIPVHHQFVQSPQHFFQPENVEELREKIRYVINEKNLKAEIPFEWFDWKNIIPLYENELRNNSLA